MSGKTQVTMSGLDVRTQIEPIVRKWLEGGVSKANLRSSVRVRKLRKLSGGLKSPVVGKLTIDVKAVIKQGPKELLQHKMLMNGVNELAAGSKPRGVQAAIFPEVMAVEQVPDLPAGSDFLMIQQDLVGYQTVQSLLYTKKRTRKRVLRAVGNALPALKFIHSIAPDTNSEFADLSQKPTPFATRISSKLDGLRNFEWLDATFQHGCDINGRSLPPLDKLLPEIDTWEQQHSEDFDPRLVHGDPHLANLMTRKVRNGEWVRWIDPNPNWGFSDPAYDWGKLLHFVEPVGQAKESAKYLNLDIGNSASRPIVSADLPNEPPGVKRLRKDVDKLIRSEALKALEKRPYPKALLALAIASAHIGLAVTPVDATLSDSQRQFALAWTLDALARWFAATRSVSA